MEKLDLLDDSLQISSHMQSYLKEAAKWGKFLAIVGFVFCGLLVLFAFAAPTLFESSAILGQMDSGTTYAIVFVYILLAVLSFFPCFFLYKFSTLYQRAILMNDQESLDASFQNLKSLWKYMGIITVITIAYYVCSILYFALAE